MKRISIEVTDQQHQRLRALAELQGKTVRDFVLATAIGTDSPSEDEATALADLEQILRERANEVATGHVSERSVLDIFAGNSTDGAPERDA